MEDNCNDSDSLYARIHQLEQERDELKKDIEELCKQQAGPNHTSSVYQIYNRRIASLEQEIENLKEKLASCTRESAFLKEELSEAKRIKTQLNELLQFEVAKNAEVVKQLEYIRGVVANAFADRDQAILEAEKAKEDADLMFGKLKDAEKKVQELTTVKTKSQEQLMTLQIKLAKQEDEMEIFRKTINKFYNIREYTCRGNTDEESGWENQCDDISLDEKCACLYDDHPEAWSFNVHKEVSTVGYIATLQEEVETLRARINDLQNKLRMGLDIERYLKGKVRNLEKKKIMSDRLIVDGISSLREYHAQQKSYIIDLLDNEKSYLLSSFTSIEEKLTLLCKDISSAEVTDNSGKHPNQTIDFADTLTRALHEKVSALLLLAQQEERHAFERNVHDAMLETLKQATEEKVKALMELAVVKQEYQLLLQKSAQERNKENHFNKSNEKGIVVPGSDRLKSLLRKTALKGFFGTQENLPAIAAHSRAMDDARLQIENATLKDSMQSLERLTHDIRECRLSLIQTKEMLISETTSSTSKQLDEILREAESLKTALCIALPLSWSGEVDTSSSSGDGIADVDHNNNNEVSNFVKIDAVSAAGVEMVELLLLAARIMKEKVTERKVGDLL